MIKMETLIKAITLILMSSANRLILDLGTAMSTWEMVQD